MSYSPTVPKPPFEFIFNTIEKISENPFALVLYVSGLLQTFSMYITNVLDPVYLFQELLDQIIKDDGIPKALRIFAYNVQKFCVYELANRRTFVIFYLSFVPTLLDYSLAFFIFETLFAVFLVFARNVPLWLIVLLIHCWYFYRLSITVPKVYIIIITSFIVYFASQFDTPETLLIIDLQPLRVKHQNNLKYIQ